MKKKFCKMIQWSDLYVRDDLPRCPKCEEEAEMIIGLMGEPCWAHKEIEEIIQLTDLALGQKVRMIDIFDGKEGIITKQITPTAYEITIGAMSIATGKQYFKLITE
jgi:hypothetical protein